MKHMEFLSTQVILSKFTCDRLVSRHHHHIIRQIHAVNRPRHRDITRNRGDVDEPDIGRYRLVHRRRDDVPGDVYVVDGAGYAEVTGDVDILSKDLWCCAWKFTMNCSRHSYGKYGWKVDLFLSCLDLGTNPWMF